MIRFLIIDDEPLSRDILRRYASGVADLELVAECRDATKANRILAREHVDLIFLDIQMPGVSGISFARALTAAPLIVFATAYPQFAVEGFELNAVDYLVKPFSPERFLEAVQRTRDRMGSPGGLPDQASRKVVVRSGKKIFALAFDQILYVEGKGDYVRIHLVDRRLMVHSTLKGFLEVLPAGEFMRIQKSYAVNLGKIEYIEGNQVYLNGQNIPVSSSLREELLRRFYRT